MIGEIDDWRDFGDCLLERLLEIDDWRDFGDCLLERF